MEEDVEVRRKMGLGSRTRVGRDRMGIGGKGWGLLDEGENENCHLLKRWQGQIYSVDVQESKGAGETEIWKDNTKEKKTINNQQPPLHNPHESSSRRRQIDIDLAYATHRLHSLTLEEGYPSTSSMYDGISRKSMTTHPPFA